MSTPHTQPSGSPSPGDMAEALARRAREGDETWLEDAIEAYLDVTVTKAQRRICRTIVNNEKVLIQTANGLGKSFILACITNVWLICHYPSSVLATSGTYPKLKRTFCKPVEDLHDTALAGAGLPGTYKQSPPRIEIDGEPMQYFEAASPKDAGELEGVHEGYTLGVIEEADKGDVDAETIDSMDSLVTDQRDRIVAIANPPADESNSINALYEDPTWEVIRLSSFESHNVQVELGTAEGEMIDGLATLWKIKQDWTSFNDEEWPGVEQARTAHTRRDDLDERWYRRRAGVMPPAGAAEHRPIHVSDVKAAWNRTPESVTETPSAVAIDVARSGDMTVLAGPHGDDLRVHYKEQGTNHVEQEARIRNGTGEFPGLDSYASFRGTIDAQGEGSGLADRLCQAYPDMTRFNAGAKAHDKKTYYDRWAEGLHQLGNWLRNGGCISDRRLREELLAAARTVSFDEKHYASRNATVLKATSKSAVKDHLGRSPDCLDAAMMAIWALEVQPEANAKKQKSVPISY